MKSSGSHFDYGYVKVKSEDGQSRKWQSSVSTVLILEHIHDELDVSPMFTQYLCYNVGNRIF